ncbi:hypothetical protein MLD38_036617 [Melastoma candidum]|uniref:Uncharacterized protein n=1 Tax=Melastoma candidum TaxID=119954 RepID=A0ACB9LKH2_9MYRT|nr:hypothetical protein MLD38_036617 [Melastoma candidum]
MQTTTSSCFNVLYPGFILTRSDLPIDGIIEPVSHPSGPVYYKDYRIYRDKASAVWYLQVGRRYTTVGYWPPRLFTGLTDLADYMDWGGEAYSDPDIAGPPMGRGVLPSGDLLENASVKDIVIINEAGDKSPATRTEAYADKELHYGVKDGGVSKQPLYHYITYGGPGGATGW